MAQIKKDTSLRKAILQAAITGQLISTVDAATHAVIEPVEITGGESLPLARTSLLTTPSSRGSAPKTPAETGKQLLDRIIEERNKKLLAEWEEALKKNPKAKKPTPIVASEIDEDEIPFEIPENWCWCRLGDLFNILSARRVHQKDWTIEGVPFYRAREIAKLAEFGFVNNELFISESHFAELQPSGVPAENDLMVTAVGTLGKTYIVKKTDRFYYKDASVICFENRNGMNPYFIKNFMDSPFMIEQIKSNSSGTTVGTLTIERTKEYLIPLPPLSVQNAIVAKLEQVLPLVDAYENAVLQKEELKSTLSDKVKKAILQEAITGKLTEHWRKQKAVVEPVETTESGEQLLDRIIKERNAKALAEWEEKVKTNPKAKKPVPIVANEIEEDEMPFEIPESWCWCHLGEICNEIKRGKSPKYVDRSDYLAFAQKCNVKTGGIDLGLALYLDEKTIDRYSEEDNLMQGDVVINSTGGGTMGRVGYYETKVPDGIKGVYPDSHVTVIRSIGKINQRYLYYVLKHNQPILEDCGTGSTNQTELKPGVLADFVIPLPPLEEQEEIVKRVEELLPLII